MNIIIGVGLTWANFSVLAGCSDFRMGCHGSHSEFTRLSKMKTHVPLIDESMRTFLSRVL